MSLLKTIIKNKMKRKISNDDCCGLCHFLGNRIPGNPIGTCKLKNKEVSIINFELHDPDQEECFKLRITEVVWND